MNKPSRFLYGFDDYYWVTGRPWAHAWCEVYVNGDWYHCDPTNDLFDRPWTYALMGVTIDRVKIYSGGDDGIGEWDYCDPKTGQCYCFDGDDYNGKLDYCRDWMYVVLYDGPNSY